MKLPVQTSTEAALQADWRRVGEDMRIVVPHDARG